MKKIKKKIFLTSSLLPIIPIFSNISFASNNQTQTNVTDKIQYKMEIHLKYQIYNFKTIEEDVKFFKFLNQEFANYLKGNLYDVTEIDYSRLSPVIWLTFKDWDRKADNLAKLNMFDFVGKVKVYENNFPKNQPNRMIPIEEVPITLPPGNDLYSSYNHNKYKEEEKIDWSQKDIYKEHFKIVNVYNYVNKKDINLNGREGKIGIMEWANKNINTSNFFKKNWINIYNNETYMKNSHGTNVTKIIGGISGVDKNAEIYFTGHLNSNEWIKKLEWMVIDNGVRIINHSYGPKGDYDDYNDNVLFLDYLSRKYGVINVFSAGNGQNKPAEKNEWINGDKISFNSIVVGSTNLKKDYLISDFSNWQKFQKYNELPKPLVVAPGEYYKTENGFQNGTSYSAPLVTGIISLLLKEKEHINNDRDRLTAIKSILAVSSYLSSQYKDNNLNRNGLHNKVGTGMVDFEKMLLASSNTKTIEIDKNISNQTVFQTDELYLLKDQNIKAAASWTFNAGLLKEPEVIPSWANWLLWWMKDKILEKTNWKDNHLDGQKLTFNKILELQKNKFFTDYDLILEYKNNNKWEVVSKTFSYNSNVDLINEKVEKSGIYRIKVVKYQNILFNQSVNDILSFSYLVE
ncbi:S8 family serine peptidase [Mesomycoplasma lagogenitalium]|uniref:S8 family serine peptidase n=1 Tax=Mesomycoplasma lagogenitalium TaxID=171286 RepID=A0ABY8LUV8_9BACT|nr:S8 family serine peptidase [Mesomycoplasma lagogenitalium]WGI37022.1 S8 family serine peptidase [Mesomycoplasma lagogenitalium]